MNLVVGLNFASRRPWSMLSCVVALDAHKLLLSDCCSSIVIVLVCLASYFDHVQRCWSEQLQYSNKDVFFVNLNGWIFKNYRSVHSLSNMDEYQFAPDSDQEDDAVNEPNGLVEPLVAAEEEILPDDDALLVQQAEVGRLNGSTIDRLTVYEMDQFCVRGFTFANIARMLKVSPSALYRWRLAHSYSPPTVQVSNGELDLLVRSYQSDNVRRGEVLTMGYLRARGVAVTRQRLRESIWRVDPHGRHERRTLRAKRVQYTVAGVHHLWHIDGNHKLIKYGLVIHGGIDGYSRGIVFLRCVKARSRRTSCCTCTAREVQRWPPCPPPQRW